MFIQTIAIFLLDLRLRTFLFTGKSEKSPALLLRSFLQYFVTTNVQREFEAPAKIISNRVQKQQLRIIHRASRIECYLLFDNDVSVIKAAKIICDVITMKPICMLLVSLHVHIYV